MSVGPERLRRPRAARAPNGLKPAEFRGGTAARHGQPLLDDASASPRRVRRRLTAASLPTFWARKPDRRSRRGYVAIAKMAGPAIARLRSNGVVRLPNGVVLLRISNARGQEGTPCSKLECALRGRACFSSCSSACRSRLVEGVVLRPMPASMVRRQTVSRMVRSTLAARMGPRSMGDPTVSMASAWRAPACPLGTAA